VEALLRVKGGCVDGEEREAKLQGMWGCVRFADGEEQKISIV